MNQFKERRNQGLTPHVAWCWLLLAGCELAPEEAAVVETKQQQVSGDDQDTSTVAGEGEGPTKTAVTIDWNERTPTAAKDHFSVMVHNNSDTAQSVHLVLSATSFSGEVVEQALSDLVLSPNESRPAIVDVDDVPIQSSGHPGSLRVVAVYSERGKIVVKAKSG